jgi:ketosteroid isomerase-like protein
MSQQDNIEAARANFEAISKQDKDLWDPIHAPDYLGEEPGVPEAMNVEQHWMFLVGMTTAFPDSQFEFTRTIATGDYVVVHWTPARITGRCPRQPATPSRPRERRWF